MDSRTSLSTIPSIRYDQNELSPALIQLRRKHIIRSRSSSNTSDLGNVIASVPSFPTRLFLISLYIGMMLLVSIISIITAFGALTPDYDFVPAILQNPGLAVNEVWSHIGLDFPDT